MSVSERAQRRRKKVAVGEFLDEQQQDETIAGFQARVKVQDRLYRLWFLVVLALPTPLYVLRKPYRSHAKLALISLLCISSIAFSTRMSRANAARTRQLNIVFGSLVALSAYLSIKPFTPTHFLWFFPLTMSVTSYIIENWLNEVTAEIERLGKFRYVYKGA